MNTKTLSLMFLTAVLVLFSIAFASALTLTPSSSTVTLTSLAKTASITLSGTPNYDISTAMPATLTINGTAVSVSALNVSNLSSTTLTFAVSTFPSLAFGKKLSGVLTINSAETSNSSATSAVNITVVLENNNFCSNATSGDLAIDEIEFDVVEGFGDDTEWYPLDEAKITFNVENNGDYDIENIEPKICLFDKVSEKCVLDEEDMDLSEESFDLDSDDDLDVTATFNVDPDKLKAGNTDYAVYISAKGKIDDSDSPNDGASQCIYDSEDMKIRTNEKTVILKDIIVPDSVICGTTFDISADIWNIGDDDIEKDEVYVFIYNAALGIRQTIELNEDLDSFDKQAFSWEGISVPKNLTLKSYAIEFSVYDSDDLDDVYEIGDSDSKYLIPLKIECQLETKNVTISADFSDETPNAVIGNQVVIEAEIRNTGNAAASYTITLDGISGWATIADIDPETFTLNAGESRKVNLYLDIDSDAEVGTSEFTIKATSGTSVFERKVQLALESGFSSSKIFSHLRNNWLIYTIVLVNLILIIAIIIAVKSIYSRSSH